MPLDKDALRKSIEEVLRENQKPDGGSDPEQQIEDSIISLSRGIANAIHSYITKADVVNVSVDPNSGKSIPPAGKLS